MNVWKPIAILATAGLVASLGIQVASANKNPAAPPPVAGGPCDGQPNMSAAVGSLNAAWNSLNSALPDKKGKRVEAMADIKNNAIPLVQAGCLAGGSN